ncbi:MAG: hypothetical protein EBR79_04030, partial [Proteobacteria bacterium]|nr:hypothetical protein [Pseudomonadota bacterium]
FLRGQAAHYAAAELVNSLSPEELGGRVLVVELRNVLYFLQRPYFQNQLEYSVVVPVAFNDVAAVWRALRVGGFGAWVSEEVGPPREGALDGHGVLRELLARGCVVELARNTGVQRASRTMASLGEVRRVYVVYKLVPDVCPLEAVVAEAPVTRLYRGAIPMVEPRAVGIQERHE